MTVRECPYCAEEIKAHAVKCKHCGSVMPEQQQQEYEEMVDAEAEQITMEAGEIARLAKQRLVFSYGFAVLGLVVGYFAAGLIRIEAELTDTPWYFLPAGIAIGGYVLWSLYWGIQIVHDPVRAMFSNIFVIGNGVADLIQRVIGLWLGMYLIVIPISGILVGALGGGMYKHYQFSKMAKFKIEE